MADKQKLKEACFSGGDRVALKQVEEWLIVATLERCQMNAHKAARILGVSRRTVYRRMHDYGLIAERDDVEQGA